MIPAECSHCGGPMVTSVGVACDAKSSYRMQFTHCPSPECRLARDEAALQRAIKRGVIDP